MPVIVRTSIRRLSQAEFGDLAYSVMGCVFQIHRDLGRFFDEKIYKRELAHRYPGVQLEVPIEVSHATFWKLQYIDVLVEGGGPFEVKAVEAMTPRHAAQLLNYLLLTAVLRDWGTALNLEIYEEAVTHFLGGEACVLADVEVRTPERLLGHQKMRLAAPRVAFALTALPETDADYESHARRLLRHMALEAILWANIELKRVTFTTVT